MSRTNFWSKLFGSRPVTQLPREGRRRHFVTSHQRPQLFRRLLVEGLEDRTCLSTLDFSTNLGGTADDQGLAIAVDPAGNSYVAGRSFGVFPVTPGAYDTTYNGGQDDAFVVKFGPSGLVVWATYLGGSGDENPLGIAVDSSGNVYVTGQTNGAFPTTAGAFQTAYHGGSFDNFVAKLDSTGSDLVYSTYLGGSADDYGGFGIAVDASGNAYIGGSTRSGDFPTTPGAFQTSKPDSPNVGTVTKLNASGTGLIYSTYLDGNTGSFNDGVYGIAVDAAGDAYVSGDTAASDFPTTVGAFQSASSGGGQHAFVAKLNAAGSGLIYSTYVSGSSGDSWGIGGIAIDSSGNAYTTGWTDSSSFPTTTGALQTAPAGAADIFVSKLNPTGTGLVFSTYLGGSGGDQSPPYGGGISVDGSDNVFVTGLTNSSDFPNVNGVQSGYAGETDAFATKLNASGMSLAYSTYLGGSGSENSPFTLCGIAVDAAGNAYLTGNTNSTNFPTVNPAQSTNGGGQDAFVVKITDVIPVALSITAANTIYNGSAYAISNINPALSPVTAVGTTTYTFYADAGGANVISAPINAGTYYVKGHFASSDLAQWSDADSSIVRFTIAKAALTGIATTQDALNYLGKQGSFTIALNSVSGLLGSDTVASVFASAVFTLQIGANTYAFAPSVSVDSVNDAVYVTYTLRGGTAAGDALRADLALLEASDGTGVSTSASKASVDTFWVYAESTNYSFADQCLTRLFAASK